jgi:hypothetical protein
VFERDVAAVLSRMRSDLAEVIAAIPGNIAKAADLHRALRIDRKLSWKVFKVASATNPLAAGSHVPSRASLETFLRSAAKSGVPAHLITAASQVARDFDEVVAMHAGDRATFDSMVSSLGSDETAEQVDLVHRRLAFRGQRHILGVQAKTQLKLVAMQPSADPRMLDGVRVEGFVKLRRLRCSAPVVVSYSGARNDDGSPREIQREPLEPVTSPHGMSLLQEFCSKPLPEFRAMEVGQGFVKGELVSRDVGNCAAVTCVEGHITRAALPRYSEEGNRISGNVVTVRTPCEAVVVDLMLREDTYGPITPSVFVHAEHLGEIIWQGVIQERHRLPVHQTVSYLGKGPSVLHTPDVPRYAAMGRYVLDRVGWDGERFDVYRCRIEYPVMPSSIVVRFDLPEAPGA